MGQRHSTERKDQLVQLGDSGIREEAPVSDEYYKLLLLGTGEAGKSTIFKQVQFHFGKDFSAYKLDERESIVSSFLVNLRSFLRVLARLYGTTGDEVADRYLDSWNTTARPYRRLRGTHINNEIKDFTCRIWNSKNAQEVWKRRNEFQLSESLEYFCQRETLSRMNNPRFEPIPEDYLQYQITTSGLYHVDLNINGKSIHVVDTGGQRSERLKWNLEFNGVSAVMFVVALDEFDRVLFEDYSTNRWEESVKLLASVSNSKHLESTPFVLAMNRVSLLERKLGEKEKAGVNLDEYFPELNLGSNYEEAVPQVLEYMEKQLVSNLSQGQPYLVQYVNAVDKEAFPHWFTNCFEWVESVCSRN